MLLEIAIAKAMGKIPQLKSSFCSWLSSAGTDLIEDWSWGGLWNLFAYNQVESRTQKNLWQLTNNARRRFYRKFAITYLSLF